MGHYKSPQTESPSTIKEYVSSYHSYYDKLFVVRDMNAFQELQQKGVKGVPTVQIFDKHKRLLTMASESSCKWALTNFFQNHSDEMISTDSTIYPYVLERLKPIDIKSDQDTFNYYLITYWAKYIPKLSHRLFEQTNTMKDSMDQKVCFMSVSLDAQENWEVE